MARYSSILRGGMLALTAAFLAATGPAAAQTVLKYSNWIPIQHVYNTDVIVPWAADVARVTEGRVKIEILPKVVGSAAQQFEVVRDGMADVVTMVPGYTPGRYDAFGLGEVPMVSSDPRTGAVAFQHLYDKHLAPLNMFKGAHVLSAFTTAPGHVFTAKKQVKRLADLQGLKLRSPVVTTIESLQAVGAVPMVKPVNELYELLSGGVLDGTLSGLDQSKAMRLSDVAKYVTLIPGGFYSSVMIVMINQDAWQRISPADRKAIEAVSGEKFAEKVGEVFAAGIQQGLAEMKSKGTVTEASPEFVAELAKALKPVEQAAIEKARKAGVKDPVAALADLRAEVAERSKAIAK
jgi:TRAP-type transport system periplasmic protein